jgi:hypothetical protein
MSSPGSRSTSLLPRLILLGASLLVVLAIVELASWIIWQGRMARLEEFGRQLEQNANKKKGPWDDLPKLKGMFVVAQPNARGTTAGVLFENNSHGFRGPERPLVKPAKSFRVAVIGDSVTMGFGALFEETYAARIEVGLNEVRSDFDYEVINVGLSGLEAPAVVARFEAKALQFDPDLVLYGYTLNDIEGKHYRKSYGGRDRNNTRFFESPFHTWRILGPKMMAMSDLLFAPEGSYQHELDDNYFANPKAWQEVLRAFDRLQKISDERGICAVLMVHTRLESLHALHPYQRFYEVVNEAAVERGFFTVISQPAFDGREATDLWITPFDAHPNGEGHALLAQVALERLAGLPDRCWERRQNR